MKRFTIITAYSVMALAVPFILYALPLGRFFDDWPTVNNTVNNNEQVDAGRARLPVPYDETRLDRPRVAEPALETRRDRRDVGMQLPDDSALKSPPPIRLRIVEKEGFTPFARYLDQVTDPNGVVTRKGFFGGEGQNLPTEAMNVFNAKARKHGMQPFPEGFLSFETTQSLIRLRRGREGRALFDTHLTRLDNSYDDSGFGTFLGEFQPAPRNPGGPGVARGYGAVQSPNPLGPGLGGVGPQPVLTIDDRGHFQSEIPAQFTIVLPKILVFRGSPTHRASLLYANPVSETNFYLDIGFIMTFAKRNEDPKHVFTIIYSDLPNPRLKTDAVASDIGFYVAEARRFKEGLKQSSNRSVSLTEFLNILQKDGVVKLFSIERRRYPRFGRDYEWIVEIPYVPDVNNPDKIISRVEWLR